jgi:hypothetical protein
MLGEPCGVVGSSSAAPALPTGATERVGWEVGGVGGRARHDRASQLSRRRRASCHPVRGVVGPRPSSRRVPAAAGRRRPSRHPRRARGDHRPKPVGREARRPIPAPSAPEVTQYPRHVRPARGDRPTLTRAALRAHPGHTGRTTTEKVGGFSALQDRPSCALRGAPGAGGRSVGPLPGQMRCALVCPNCSVRSRLERPAESRISTLARLLRLQEAVPVDSGSCGGDTVGVQVPPFALSYFNSLCGAPSVAARRTRAVVRNVVRAVRHFLLIDGTLGVVPRCAARYAARRSAASACTASRRTL